MKNYFKKLSLLTSMFLAMLNSLLAQNNMQDVLYLKNGTVVRGTIIETIPNQSVKIQTTGAYGNTTTVYKMDEINKMTKENINTGNFSSSSAANSNTEQVFTKSSSILSAGIGIPNELQRLFNELGADAKGSVVIEASYEHGLSDEWSMGGVFAYATASLNSEIYTGYPYWYSTQIVEDKWSFLIIGIKGDYHFGSEKLDAYGGAILGYASISETQNGVEGTGISGLVYYPHIGIRYPFTPNFLGYVELGYGISIFNLGLSIALK